MRFTHKTNDFTHKLCTLFRCHKLSHIIKIRKNRANRALRSGPILCKNNSCMKYIIQ